jgi:hypothetical protein
MLYFLNTYANFQTILEKFAIFRRLFILIFQLFLSFIEPLYEFALIYVFHSINYTQTCAFSWISHTQNSLYHFYIDKFSDDNSRVRHSPQNPGHSVGHWHSVSFFFRFQVSFFVYFRNVDKSQQFTAGLPSVEYEEDIVVCYFWFGFWCFLLSLVNFWWNSVEFWRSDGIWMENLVDFKIIFVAWG